ERNKGVAALPGIPRHILEFQTRLEIHPEAGGVAAGPLIFSWPSPSPSTVITFARPAGFWGCDL
ncbi:MAG TPA: hypothetical protein VJT54_17980, partial [Verrucomicrobiae bacterium]|nr:hypothetical protein [Verrucomicrobiae bacterium]